MLADAGGIGYGEYLQVFAKKTNTFEVTNYAVQLNQKRSDLVFCLFASKRILLEHFSAYDLILRPNFIPSRDNKIQNLKPVSPRQSNNICCRI